MKVCLLIFLLVDFLLCRVDGNLVMSACELVINQIAIAADFTQAVGALEHYFTFPINHRSDPVRVRAEAAHKIQPDPLTQKTSPYIGIPSHSPFQFRALRE